MSPAIIDDLPVLDARSVSARYGAYLALDKVSLHLRKGARHALIGPNGAGKSTFLNLLTGTLKPSSGQIFFDGMRIDDLPPDERVRRGLGRSFQVNELFPELSPIDTLMLAIARKRGKLARPWLALHRQSDIADEAFQLASSVGLGQDCLRRTSELPYGRQRLLDIALSLAGDPGLLLLDEPAAGLANDDAAKLIEIIEAFSPRITILLIDHNTDLVLRLARSASFLLGGRIAAEGTPADVVRSESYRSSYLGLSQHG